jgi:hypothetical protein
VRQIGADQDGRAVAVLEEADDAVTADVEVVTSARLSWGLGDAGGGFFQCGEFGVGWQVCNSRSSVQRLGDPFVDTTYELCARRFSFRAVWLRVFGK